MKLTVLSAAAYLLASTLLPLPGPIAGASASAVEAKTPSPPVDVDRAGLAARGYDVTAFFTSGRAVPGSAQFEVRHQGAVFRFASAAAKELFEADPAAFVPQFGGYCAWAVSQGYVAPGDPTQWAIVDGKLYLNFNSRAKALWDADRPAAIARGLTNWPRVLAKNQNL